MKRIFLVVLVAALSVAATAEPIKLKNGKVYEATGVTREDRLLIISTDHAEFGVPWDELDEAVARKFFPDLQQKVDEERKAREALKALEHAAIAEAEKNRAAERERFQKEKAEYMARLSSCEKIDGKVLQVLKEGLLMDSVVGQEIALREERFRLSKTRLLVGHPDHDRMTDEQSVNCYAYRDGIFEYLSVIGAKKTIEVWRYFVPDPRFNDVILGTPRPAPPRTRPPLNPNPTNQLK